MVRLKDQRHPPAFHLGIALDLADRPKIGFDSPEQGKAQVLVGHFPAFESQCELHLVPLFEEPFGAVDLDFQVVVPDADRIDVELFEPTPFRAGPALIFLLLLLITPLPVVHDFAHGGAGGRRDFNQVQSNLLGFSEGVARGRRTDFDVVLVDEEDRRDADLTVDAEVRRNGLSLQNSAEGRMRGGPVHS